jgi:hypothetical protein
MPRLVKLDMKSLLNAKKATRDLVQSARVITGSKPTARPNLKVSSPPYTDLSSFKIARKFPGSHWGGGTFDFHYFVENAGTVSSYNAVIRCYKGVRAFVDADIKQITDERLSIVDQNLINIHPGERIELRLNFTFPSEEVTTLVYACFDPLADPIRNFNIVDGNRHIQRQIVYVMHNNSPVDIHIIHSDIVQP